MRDQRLDPFAAQQTPEGSGELRVAVHDQGLLAVEESIVKGGQLAGDLLHPGLRRIWRATGEVNSASPYHLPGTRLVFLIACQTGMGEIDGGQRAAVRRALDVPPAFEWLPVVWVGGFVLAVLCFIPMLRVGASQRLTDYPAPKDVYQRKLNELNSQLSYAHLSENDLNTVRLNALAAKQLGMPKEDYVAIFGFFAEQFHKTEGNYKVPRLVEYLASGEFDRGAGTLKRD